MPVEILNPAPVERMLVQLATYAGLFLANTLFDSGASVEEAMEGAVNAVRDVYASGEIPFTPGSEQLLMNSIRTFLSPRVPGNLPAGMTQEQLIQLLALIPRPADPEPTLPKEHN